MLAAVTSKRFVPLRTIVAPGPTILGEKPVIVGAAIKRKPGKLILPAVAVTLTIPLAPAPTTARIKVSVTAVKEAAFTPPKLTERKPTKFRPMILTIPPDAAAVGVKRNSDGGGLVVNAEEINVPPCDVTATAPPLRGTTARMTVEETIVKFCAGILPKFTAVTPDKFVPVIVIVSPGEALEGVIPVITGAGTKVNPENDAEPPGVVITTFPLAPVLTTAVICVGDKTRKLRAGTPPKLAVEAPKNPLPVMVTVISGPAIRGEKSVICGVG